MKNISIILLIGLTIIMSGCLSDKTNENQSEKTDINQNESKDNYIDYSEQVVNTAEVIEKIENMELTAPPQFKIPQKFVYNSTPSSVSGVGYYREELVFTIENIEEIDGRKYYAITRNLAGFLNEFGTIGMEERLEDIITTWYCDKENGRCIGKNMGSTNYSDENSFVTDSSMFAYWMLGLKENLKWNMYITATQDNMVFNVKYEFEVVGKEKVDDIECFKVKMRYVDTDTKKVEETRYYWIDVTRRILIKKEVYKDSLRLFEQKLVKES
jgi:hypothetical protein